LSSVEDLNIATVKIDEIQDMIHEEEKRKFECLSLSLSTWVSVMLSIIIFVACICCSCCCCKCCRQFGFWMWDKWTPKECLRQTRNRCCVINNYNADRISYTEVSQTPRELELVGTPPDSPLSSRSLPVSLAVAMSEPRRCAYRLAEDFELGNLRAKSKTKERKGER
jgi:hypothetical protein